MFQYFCDASRPGLSAMQLTEWARQAREGNSPFAAGDDASQRNLRQEPSRRIGFGWIWRWMDSTDRSLQTHLAEESS